MFVFYQNTLIVGTLKIIKLSFIKQYEDLDKEPFAIVILNAQREFPSKLETRPLNALQLGRQIPNCFTSFEDTTVTYPLRSQLYLYD